MAASDRKYVDDVPDDVEERLRAICLALPDAYEEKAWAGVRWKVRAKTFAHVLGIELGGGHHEVVVVFRADGEELEMLRHAGPPFRVTHGGGNARKRARLVVHIPARWTAASLADALASGHTAGTKSAELGRPSA